MAEIRKHRPGSASAIGDQVRATIGSGPRPVDPGELADPTVDPFFVDEPTSASGVVSDASAVTAIQTQGWFSFSSDAWHQATTHSVPPAAASEPDDDSEADDSEDDEG